MRSIIDTTDLGLKGGYRMRRTVDIMECHRYYDMGFTDGANFATMLCANGCANEVVAVDIIFNEPATIVKWKDGTKTVVKCQKGDTYDREKGLALCVLKKMLGNSSKALNDILRFADDSGEQWREL